MIQHITVVLKNPTGKLQLLFTHCVGNHQINIRGVGEAIAGMWIYWRVPLKSSKVGDGGTNKDFFLSRSIISRYVIRRLTLINKICYSSGVPMQNHGRDLDWSDGNWDVGENANLVRFAVEKSISCTALLLLPNLGIHYGLPPLPRLFDPCPWMRASVHAVNTPLDWRDMRGLSHIHI